VCLLAFGLNAVVLARGFVRCTDEHGTARIEWSCEKDEQDHCQVVCDGSPETGETTDHSQSQPCEDTPANSVIVATDRTVAAKSFELPPMMLVAVLHTAQAAVPAMEVFLVRRGPTIAASPPSLLTIRTVVILV